MMRLLTVASASYVPLADVMFESARRFHPELRLTLLVPDVTRAGLVQLKEQGVGELADLLCVEDLAVDYLETARSYYDALEFCSALKVLGSAHILKSESECLFLDPDMLVLDRLDTVLQADDAVLVTPHAVSPMPADGCRPDDLEMCSAGVVNGGVLRTRRGAAGLDWLASHTRSHWFVAPGLGMYADQLWLTSLPLLFGDTRLLRAPAINVAYWNLHERSLRETNGVITLADGTPVTLFHFSGFSVPSGGRLTTHSERRYDAQTEAVLIPFIASYERRLCKARARWSHLKGDIAFCRDPLQVRLARAAAIQNEPRLMPPHLTSFKARMKSVFGLT